MSSILNNKSIFLDSGFKDFQLLYMIPVVCAYADTRGIKEIIFQDELPKKVLEDKTVNKLLRLKKVTILKKKISFIKIIKIVELFLSIHKIIFYFILFNFRLLKKNSNWYLYQLMHAFWDNAYVNSKDTELTPSYFNRIKSVLMIIMSVNDFKKINKNIDTVFLSHTVYSARVLLASFRNEKVNIFSHANCNIYKVDKFKDNSSNFVENSNLKKLLFHIKKEIVNKYWNSVITGNSKNLETNSISKIKNKFRLFKNDQSYNVIFLHVFRDSPYSDIDKSRIFFGYHDWFWETLKILKDSDENWIIRTHPSMYKWGENSNIIVEKFIKKAFNNNIIPANIKIQDKLTSNFFLLKNAKKIITYSGNVHIEAACLGRKPICISQTTLEKVDKNFILKPHSINNYKELLLKKSDDTLFKLKQNLKQKAKSILFIKDKALSFSDILESNHIYRSSSFEEKKFEFNKNKKKIKVYLKFFQKIGSLHARGLSQSVTKSYLNIINDRSFI
jgi:hypothetical protein